MLNDVRYAIRKLRQNPGFALTAIVSIALASGANTAIFSVLNAVLLRPLPYANPHQLVIVWEKHPAAPFDRFPTSPADFEDWRADAKSFERLSAFGFGGPAMTLTGAGEPESLPALQISTDTFDLVGIPPYLGRTFRPGDELAKQGSPAIIRPLALVEAVQLRSWRDRQVGHAGPEGLHDSWRDAARLLFSTLACVWRTGSDVRHTGVDAAGHGSASCRERVAVDDGNRQASSECFNRTSSS